MDAENGNTDWRKRYETLKLLAIRAIEEHDDLKKKYVENLAQYNELKVKHTDTEAQLFKLQSVLEPACAEFSQLNENYEVEKTCRSQAERVASQYYKQNKELKRQSQHLTKLITEANIPISDLGTITENDSREDNDTEDQESLNVKIVGLEAELKLLEERLEASEKEKSLLEGKSQQDDKIKTLEENLRKAEEKAKNYQQQLESVKTVSDLAWNDYEQLREKHDRLAALNHEAVAYASKMLSERDAVIRQSTVLLSSAASDQRLMQALQEIEALTKRLKEEEDKNVAKVKELEKNLRKAEDSSRAKDLENRLFIAVKDMENLQKSFTELEKAYQELDKWKSKLERENLILIDNLDVAQQKLRPAPPPPAPPPPPPLLIRPFKLLIKRKEGSAAAGPSLTRAGKPKDRAYEDAMAEMMERIKHGRGLKPAGERPRPPVQETKQSSAMLELQKVLKNMKKIDSVDV